jgi:hypothetical protein
VQVKFHPIRRQLFLFHLRLPEQFAAPGQMLVLAAVAQDAVVAHARHALGNDVLQEPGNELHRRDGQLLLAWHGFVHGWT